MTQPTGIDALTAYIVGNPSLIQRPQVVNALANTGATPQQAGAINQFVAGNTNQGIVAAHQVTGETSTPHTQQLGEPPTPEPKPGGGWSFGRIMHDVTHNPVTNSVGYAGKFVLKAVNDAANFANAGLGTAFSLLDGHAGQTLDSIHQQMDNAGYDRGNFFSAMAFMASGQQRLDLTALQAKTDPATFTQAENVANANALHDKAAFGAIQNSILNNTSLSQDEKDSQIRKLYSKDFQDLVAQISVRKSTFGNWAFEGRNPDNKLESFLAGATDFAVGLKTDPTIVAGNIYKARTLSKITLDSMGDTDTVYNVLSGATKGVAAARVRNGVQTLVDNSNALRKAIADGDEAGIAVAQRNVKTLTPDLQHLEQEFTGGGDRAIGVIKRGPDKGTIKWGKAKPITTMDQAAAYLSSEAGVVRLMAGKAQAEIGIMPGQLGHFGATAIQRNVRAYIGGKATRAGIRSLQLDLRKQGIVDRIIPTYADRMLTSTGKDLSDQIEGGITSPTELASKTRSNARAIGTQQFLNRTGFETVGDYTSAGTISRAAHALTPDAVVARGKLLVNRLSGALNKVDILDTADQEFPEKVQRYGQLYLTRSHSLLLAGLAAGGNEGTQKAIAHGLALSVFHAAGLSTSDAGARLIKQFSREFTKNRYSSTGSAFRDPATGLTRDSAIWDSQLNTVLSLPNFNRVRQLSAKVGIWENTVGRVFNSQLVTELTNLDRWSWLLRPAGAVRNIVEEMAGVWGRGEVGVLTKSHLAQSLADQGPARLAVSNKLFSPLARLGDWYQQIGVRNALEHPELGMKYQLRDAEDLTEQANKHMGITMRRALDPGADIADIVNAGYKVGKVKMVRSGFGEKETFDVTGHVDGAIAYAHNLAAAMSNPKLAQKLILHIENPGQTTLEDVAAELKKGKNYSKYTRATIFADAPTGIDMAVTNKAEQELATSQHAQTLVAEMKHLISKPDSEDLNNKLVAYMKEEGKAPDYQWIADNIKSHNRPTSVLAPLYEAMPTEGGKLGLLKMASDLAGEGYSRLVIRPIDRWITQPLYRANYGKMRAFMEPWENQLVEGGLKPKVADMAAKDISMQMAWTRTMKYVDNSEMRTQLDVVGKSFFAFSRATTAFMVRWGKQLIEDPTRARRLMLAYEAGVNTGFLYDDANGNKQFVFPGSGWAISEITRAFDAIPGVGGVYVPGATPNLTSQFQFLNSGLQNPAQFSLTPIANIPLRSAERLFPSVSQTLNQVDTFLNGQQGTGKSFWSQFEPTTIRQFSDALTGDDKQGLLANTVRSAILTLGAANMAPGSQKNPDGTPKPADEAEVQQYLNNVTAQAKNHLVGRAIFGLFAPAAPGVPTEDNAVGKSDWIYGALGIHNLSDEFKEIANEVGIANAYVVWAQIHPDKLMYETSESTSTVKNAELQATAESQKWLVQNYQFMKDYAGVGAYFLPPAANKGKFDYNAYRSELQLGLRQYKTTSDFFHDVVLAQSNQQYFDAIKVRDAAIAKDPNGASTISDQFSAWKKDFIAVNPLWQASQNSYQDTQSTAKDQLNQLRRMVDAPSGLPASVPVKTVRQMLSAYDTYHAAIAQYPRQTNQDTAARASISGQYATWWQGQLLANPAMGGLYSGVFRSIDTSVLDPIGG
jgi:hypothetical protein